MSKPFTIALRVRAERLDHFAIGADDLATAGICRATAARIREIASEIDRLEYLLATLERRPTYGRPLRSPKRSYLSGGR
jgi:hypothetical protein